MSTSFCYTVYYFFINSGWCFHSLQNIYNILSSGFLLDKQKSRENSDDKPEVILILGSSWKLVKVIYFEIQIVARRVCGKISFLKPFYCTDVKCL